LYRKLDGKETDEGPKLEPFEIVYKWKAVHEEDISKAVNIMFILTIIILILINAVVCSTYDEYYPNKRSPSTISRNRSY